MHVGKFDENIENILRNKINNVKKCQNENVDVSNITDQRIVGTLKFYDGTIEKRTL